MKRLNGLHASVLVVLVANAMALRHAWVNRHGATDAEIVLTDRELAYRGGGQNGSVFLRLEYRGKTVHTHDRGAVDTGAWIGEQELQEIGFDCSVGAKEAGAYDHYRKQKSRAVIAALEYREEADVVGSRLFAVGVGRDVASMRRRFPDRSKVILVPAAVRIFSGDEGPRGYLMGVPATIHVPHEFQAGFRSHPVRARGVEQDKPLYRVRLRYGANLEPWVVGVEFPRQ